MTDLHDPEIQRRLRALGRFLGDSANDPQLGPYQVVREVGRGAMGIVYEGFDDRLKRRVAIKVINKNLPAQPVLERFRREAQSLARVSHPNVIHVHDVGEADGWMYIVLEFVEGQSLREILADPAATLDRKVRLLAGAAAGVGAAHREGIIHRDLKPPNVLVGPGDVTKVADFGLAAGVEGQGTLTVPGTALGTPAYMAPEQAVARGDLSPATDVYSLGVILYEILTGRLPFLETNVHKLLAAIIYEEAPRPSTIRPSAPKELEAVCLKAMDKEPHRRYADAEKFAEDLNRYLDGEPVTATPPSPIRAVGRAIRRRALVLLLVLVSLVAVWALTRTTPPASPALRNRAATLDELRRWTLEWSAFDDAGFVGWRPMARIGPQAMAQVLAFREQSPGVEADLLEAIATWNERRLADCVLASTRALDRGDWRGAALGALAKWAIAADEMRRGNRPGSGLEEALSLIRRGAALRADERWAFLTSLVRRTQGELDESMSALESVANAPPGLLPLFRGAVKLERPRALPILEEAISDFTGSAKLRPDSPWPLLFMARALREHSLLRLTDKSRPDISELRLEEGLAAAQRALQLDPGSVEARVEAGRLYLTKARALGAIQVDPGPTYDLAIESLQAAVEAARPSVETLCTLGDAWMQRQAPTSPDAGRCLEKAAEIYDRAIETDPYNGRGHWGRASVMELRAHLPGISGEEALAFFEAADRSATQAINLTPAAGGYFFKRGVIRQGWAERLRLMGSPNQERIDGAVDDFRKALDRSPTMLAALQNLALALGMSAQSLFEAKRDPMARLEESLREWNRLLEADPANQAAIRQRDLTLRLKEAWSSR